MIKKLEPFKFSLFDNVQKRSGYRFPGKIVSCYHTLGRKARYVVECTDPNVKGCQHIFAGSQLKRRKSKS